MLRTQLGLGVLFMAWAYATAAENGGAVASRATTQSRGVATVRIPFPANGIYLHRPMEPRVFARGAEWLFTTVVPDEYPSPDQTVGMLNCTLILNAIEEGTGALTVPEVRRITLYMAGTSFPAYAILPTHDLIKVAHESQTSATSAMITGEVKVGKQYTSPRLGSEARATQYVDGKALSYMDNTCPYDLAFVRGMAGKGQTAICGCGQKGLCLLVASKSEVPWYRWDSVSGVSQIGGSNLRGAWIDADTIVVACMSSGARVNERNVTVGVLSRSKTDDKDRAWKVLEQRTIHTGPARRIDVIRTENKVLLAIMEITSGLPRVVVYEGNEKADAFQVSGAMSLGVDGDFLDFAIDDSGKTVAGIVSTGYRKDYLVFVQPLTLGKYEKSDKQEAAALQKKLEAEWKARKAAEEEAKARQPQDLQERLQQN